MGSWARAQFDLPRTTCGVPSVFARPMAVDQRRFCYPPTQQPILAGFNGLRVLSFESGRAKEIAQLITNNGGVPIVAPSTREVPATPTDDEAQVILGLVAGECAAVIFMTGVGARVLLDI